MLCCYCKKYKLGIIVYDCSCEHKQLCKRCRLPEDHQCSFDHKQFGKNKLEKENQKVIAIKIDKI